MKFLRLSAFALMAVLALGTTPAAAEDCGQPVTDGDGPTATDALHILKSSVGSLDCTLGTCDLNSDCQVTVGDALSALVASLGGDSPVDCDAECPTEQLCGDSEAPICNGICPAGFVCSAEETDDPDHRVTICHSPPGNPANAHTIVVGRPAVHAHLRHGDHEGPCEDTPTECPADAENCEPVDDTPGQRKAKGSDGDADSDSDSDSDSDGASFECVCEPAASTTTTSLPDSTTTTTLDEPFPSTTTTLPDATTTTTVDEPTTTTTTLPDATTTTLPDSTTTTTVDEPTTTTTTLPDSTTTTTVDEPATTTTTLSDSTTTTTVDEPATTTTTTLDLDPSPL